MQSVPDPSNDIPGPPNAPADTGGFSPRQQAESQWLTNEFNSLRQEFVERFRTENLLVLGALTFLGTVLGIAFKEPKQPNELILLIVPMLMPLIGMFYLNQRLSNTTIGLYVKECLKTRLNVLLKTQVLEWEDYVRDNTSSAKELSLFLFILLLFSGSSIAVLVLTSEYWSPGVSGIACFGWWSGVVLSLIWSTLWVSQFTKWFGA